MCGIAGIVSRHVNRPDRAELAAMIATLLHRGPDAQEIYTAGVAGLAHTRLSILDLEGGGQPMSTPDGQLAITFNGEIFNYLELREELIRKGHMFRTRSDTEVILHLYQEEGERCVERFNGQWAFAIWDAPHQRLFASRDRLGVRPFFYTQTSGRFLFASEIKALLACPDVERTLDLRALDQIFTFWVTLPPRTAFRNIQQLPPGHSLTVEDGQVRVWPFWSLNYAPADEATCQSEARYADELLALLLDAVRLRMRSDVPVGAYLSGGLDSTVIAALAKSLVGDNLRTFSLTFKDAEFDESPFQREASTFLGTEHSAICCSTGDIAEVFPQVVCSCEQPILRTAPAPMFLLSRLVRANDIKVVLTGGGADEMLGGYDIFQEAKIRRFWGRIPDSSLRPRLLKRLYPYMESIQRQPAVYLEQFFHVTAADLANPLFSHLPRWKLTRRLTTFFSEAVNSELRGADPFDQIGATLPGAFPAWTPFNQAEYLEAQFLLPGYILSSQGDRMAMAHSVEGRYPFLDHRVVEFAAQLPPRLKMKVLDAKYLLKRVAEGRVPLSIRKRYKQPYRAPGGESFFRRRWEYVDELLSPDAIRRDGIFQPGAVTNLVAKFLSGRPASVQDDMALIGILSTQLLLQAFGYSRDLAHEVPVLHSQEGAAAQ